MKVKTITPQPQFGWRFFAVGKLIDRINERNDRKDEKIGRCLIEYDNQIWELKRLEDNRKKVS